MTTGGEKYVDRIWTIALEVFPAFAKAFHIPLMAVAYPALVDRLSRLNLTSSLK